MSHSKHLREEEDDVNAIKRKKNDTFIEPILDPKRWEGVLIPDEDKEFWLLYKKQQSMIWKWEEIKMGQDRRHWEKLPQSDKDFILFCLAYFSKADDIVSLNLMERFLNEVQLPASKWFLGLQLFMEQVHSETYKRLLEFFCESQDQKRKFFGAIDGISSVKKKAEWAQRYIASEEDFSLRLVAFIAVEGIMFSASFCALFWIKQRGILFGLTQSNELISKDEGLHVLHLITIFLRLERPPTEAQVKQIFADALVAEKEYAREGLQVRLVGMNATLMNEYQDFVADQVLLMMKLTKMSQAKNPFPFMENIGLLGYTNFFERGVAEYNSHNDQQTEELNLSADF